MILNDYPSRPAGHWLSGDDGRVECRLCPRHCRPANGHMGVCGVRGAVDGRLHTYNYGLSLAATEEVIETEAVLHHSPGARILSLGNIGCMLSCSFCQNWETSQIDHLDPAQLHRYTPRQLVDLCLNNDIGVLSWTYNDPVVWHEFVVETSRLARQEGLTTLYKSAFYIEEAPAAELIDCIDIFSLSLKSLSDDFYRHSTGGALAPVLRRIRQVAQSRRHLEISYLLIPGLNDSAADLRALLEWVRDHLGTAVPLHFVAFHPAYRYTEVARTGTDTLLAARDLALAMGLRHVYLGNTDLAAVNDSFCADCGALLVQRYGLVARPLRLDSAGACTECGRLSPIIAGRTERVLPAPAGSGDLGQSLRFRWHGEVQSVHVVRTAGADRDDRLRVRPLDGGATTERAIPAGMERIIVTRQSAAEAGVVLSWDSPCRYRLAPLLDRAHFPVNNLTSELE